MAEQTDLSTQDISNCPPDVCERLRQSIENACRDFGWPPGHAILVFWEGKPCRCYCE